MPEPKPWLFYPGGDDCMSWWWFLSKAALQFSISLGVSMAKFWNETSTLQRWLLVIKIDLTTSPKSRVDVLFTMELWDFVSCFKVVFKNKIHIHMDSTWPTFSCVSESGTYIYIHIFRTKKSKNSSEPLFSHPDPFSQKNKNLQRLRPFRPSL